MRVKPEKPDNDRKPLAARRPLYPHPLLPWVPQVNAFPRRQTPPPPFSPAISLGIEGDVVSCLWRAALTFPKKQEMGGGEGARHKGFSY